MCDLCSQAHASLQAQYNALQAQLSQQEQAVQRLSEERQLALAEEQEALRYFLEGHLQDPAV